MLKKTTILDRGLKNALRFFKSEFFKGQVSNSMQYHSGGEDYNPPSKVRAMSENFGDNPNNSVIWAYQDDVAREADVGEKRLYAVNSSGTVVGQIWLKNTGKISISGNLDCDISVSGTCNISAETVNVYAAKTNLGSSGLPIARVGDSVKVTVPTHGDCTGVITSGGVNTSV